MLDDTLTADRPACVTAPAYPYHLVEHVRLAQGETVTLRPIRATDIGIEADFVSGLSRESRYQRLLSGRNLLPGELRRLTQIDYRRELALIATTCVEGTEKLIGVARYVRDADGTSADIAIVVADAWQRRGLGERLLSGLTNAAGAAGVRRLTGITLATNSRMRALALKLGFTLHREPGDATVTGLLKTLVPAAAPAATPPVAARQGA